MYNACICIYYLLTVRYSQRVRPKTIQTYILPAMHIVVWVVALGSAILALSLGVLGFDGVLGCWINDDDKWKCYCTYPGGDDSKRYGYTAIVTYDDNGDYSSDWGCYGPPSCTDPFHNMYGNNVKDDCDHAFNF